MKPPRCQQTHLCATCHRPSAAWTPVELWWVLGHQTYKAVPQLSREWALDPSYKWPWDTGLGFEIADLDARQHGRQIEEQLWAIDEGLA